MLVLDYINVGYGDAILVREFDANQCVFSMLVDCGDINIPVPNGSMRIPAADFLALENITGLDMLVLTHLHLDHSGGMLGLLERTHVKSFICNHLPPEAFWGSTLERQEGLSPDARNLCDSYDVLSRSLALMRRSGTQISNIRHSSADFIFGSGVLKGEVFCELGDLCKRQDAVWSDAIQKGAGNSALTELGGYINNTSIRMRLSYGKYSAELPGDICADYWQQHVIAGCTILKLPHHGHGDSLTEELARMLSPEYTVICVSNDRTDGCPSKSILSLIDRNAGKPLFTDAVNGSSHRAVRFTLHPDALDWEYIK